MNNSRLEVIKGWYGYSVEVRSTVVNFVKKAGPEFHGESGFRLDDIAQRLRAQKYQKGDVLKEFGDDPMHLHFICHGAVGVYERRVQGSGAARPAHSHGPGDKEQHGHAHPTWQISDQVRLNLYKAGQSLGDPEINFRTPLSTRVVVAQNNTKVVSISRESFYQVYANKLNNIIHARKAALLEHFVLFSTWNEQKLKNVCELMKSRILEKDEVLFEDQTKAELLHFLVAGSLRIEKEVVTKQENFWPAGGHSWQATEVEQKVLFKVAEIKGHAQVGEKEMMYSKPYPVRVVAASSGTKVLMIHRREILKSFTTKDREKIMDVMSTVTFPQAETVLRDIDILKQVQKIKKHAFMNACNTNKTEPDVRNAVIQDPKVLKRLQWVQDVDKKVNQKVAERVKVIRAPKTSSKRARTQSMFWNKTLYAPAHRHLR